MSKPCELPPCPPCPPPTPETCTPVCTPPPQPKPPPCRMKPNMRGLHRSQTKNIIAQAITLAAIGGVSYYVFVAVPRKEAYRKFYEKGEFEDWADEMARKGLLQSVPRESLKDDQHLKK